MMRMSKARRKDKAHCPLGGANPAAYCKLHKSGITVKQMKNRDCLGKNCRWFRKILDHGYWKTGDGRAKNNSQV